MHDPARNDCLDAAQAATSPKLRQIAAEDLNATPFDLGATSWLAQFILIRRIAPSA